MLQCVFSVLSVSPAVVLLTPLSGEPDVKMNLFTPEHGHVKYQNPFPSRLILWPVCNRIYCGCSSVNVFVCANVNFL